MRIGWAHVLLWWERMFGSTDDKENNYKNAFTLCFLLLTRTHRCVRVVNGRLIATSLMKPAFNNQAISFFITSFLSWAKRQSHCLTGLAFGFRCILCSINSVGTPDMSAGFHPKMSTPPRTMQSSCWVCPPVGWTSWPRAWPGLGGLSQGLPQLLELYRCH
jgi:hypothetical protein